MFHQLTIRVHLVAATWRNVSVSSNKSHLDKQEEKIVNLLFKSCWLPRTNSAPGLLVEENKVVPLFPATQNPSLIFGERRPATPGVTTDAGGNKKKKYALLFILCNSY